MSADQVVRVRLAALEDAAEIARLNALFNGSSEPAAAYAARLKDPLRVDWPLLAEIERQAVGFANLRLVSAVFDPAPYAEITEMFVEEAYRRRGAARALLLFAEEMARQAGAEQMLILTDYYNHAAQEVYRALGYAHYDIALSKDL